MKSFRNLFLILMFIVSSDLIAQNIPIRPTSVIGNILYKGASNPILVESCNMTINLDSIVIKSKNGYLNKNKGIFYYYADKIGFETFEIYDNKDSLISKIKFKVYPAPLPNVVISTETKDNNLQLSKIQECKGLICNLPNFDLEIIYKVSSFDLTLINGNNNKVANVGYKFNDSSIDLLKRAENGNIILIENINVSLVDVKTNIEISQIKVPSVFYKIIE